VKSGKPGLPRFGGHRAFAFALSSKSAKTSTIRLGWPALAFSLSNFHFTGALSLAE
jgi:hypothetical protein